ncbi:MAG: hypothetical protein KDC11_12790, partial [Chitinophagaceae bacterium]|nr:hypothetical protein [Chitinophagaceae bacterium]
MKHLKYLLLIPVVLILTDTAASAQIDSLAMAKRRARPKPIKKEFSVGFRVNTDGWGIFVDRGAVKDPGRNTDYFYDTKLFQIEFSEKKHPQETKRTNITGAATENVKPFIFGKINNFYTLKFGYGRRKMIAGKPDPGSVSIHWVYMGGISLGLEKPYYYEAYYSKAGGPLTRETVRYTDSTKVILSPNIDSAAIVGSAGFTKGIGELKIVP